jgi:L-threonylcarbamoyladenylate synthase
MITLPADAEGVKRAAAAIRAGGLVVFPTETVYSIACLSSEPNATKNLCEARRSATEPLTIMCAGAREAELVVTFNETADRLAEHLWPGPLTLMLPKKKDLPMWVTHGSRSLGVTVPRGEIAQALTKAVGGIMVGETVNPPDEPPCLTVEQATRNLGRAVDVVLDGGKSPGDIANTILDVSTDEIWLIRKGAVSADSIRGALAA